MIEILTRLFDTTGFPARWRCGAGWTDNPALGWLHIFSDLAIWAAYFAIPGILLFFIVRKRDLPFRKVFLLFGAFILFCGTTHLMEAVIFWWPAYRLAGVIKLLTAAVSWGTIFALIQVAPLALAMRSPEALEREIKAREQADEALRKANAELELRVAERTAELTRVNLALQNEREWFRTTLSSVGDAVIATDNAGQIRFLNLVAEALTGWKAHEAEGKPLAEVLRIVHEETREIAENPALRALKEGTAVDLIDKTLLIDRNGIERPIDDSAAPIRDSNGVVNGAVLVFRDVTERREHDLSLRENETRLRLALEASHMGVFDRNLRTNQVQWSDNMETIYGLPPGGFGGTFDAFQALVHPEDRPKVAQTIQQAIDERSKYELEFRCIWPDNSIHWLTSRAMIHTTPDGQPSRVVGVCLDITERKQAEQTARFLADVSVTLSASVDYDTTFRQVAQLSVPFFADWCIVDAIDNEGRLQRAAIVHHDPAKLQMGLNIKQKFVLREDAPYSPANALRAGRSFLISNITDDMIAAFTQNDEHLQLMRQLHLKSYISVPVIARGKPLGVISFLTSDSQRRYDEADLALAEDLAHRTAIALDNAHLYQELKEADRLKDEFLAMLAHELRNPLAPIRNSLFIMRSPSVAPELTQQVLAIAERQVQHMARLLDDLLDVSRISRGRIELRKEAVDVGRVVQLALEAVQPLVSEARHEVTVSLPSEPQEIYADPTRLEQILTNLLNNACKYTEPEGHIWLEVEPQGNELVIRVRDTGIGVSAEMLPRIFDLFVQAERQLERSHGGVGIGLTLVRRLIELHGGTIEATSPGLGKGSEFIVRLPLLAVNDKQLTQSPDSPRGQQPSFVTPHRILVVDDNPDAANSLALLLRMSGYEVTTAFDGPSAIGLAKQLVPALIFLDIGMPGMDGYEVARQLRLEPKLKNARLIAITGWGQAQDRDRTAAAGIDKHLVKPIEPAMLQELLGS